MFEPVGDGPCWETASLGQCDFRDRHDELHTLIWASAVGQNMLLRPRPACGPQVGRQRSVAEVTVSWCPVDAALPIGRRTVKLAPTPACDV